MSYYFKKIGEGKPIVFLHGWGCDGSIFGPVANRLYNYAGYLVDFSGFGQSPPPPKSGWDVVNYAGELKHFFDNNNLDKTVIVAHSFGCRVAMVFAANYPEKVEKLLLVAPAGLRKFSLKRWLKVSKYRCRKFLHSVGLVEKPSGCGSADYLNCSDEMKNTFVKVINQDLSLYAKRIECETLIVNGRDDCETTLAHAKKLNKLIRNSTLAEIDGDHFAFFRSPKAFAQTIETFAGTNRC